MVLLSSSSLFLFFNPTHPNKLGSRLLLKASKLTLFKFVIRPVQTYRGSVSWKIYRTAEAKILFAPVRSGDTDRRRSTTSTDQAKKSSKKWPPEILSPIIPLVFYNRLTTFWQINYSNVTNRESKSRDRLGRCGICYRANNDVCVRCTSIGQSGCLAAPVWTVVLWFPLVTCRDTNSLFALAFFIWFAQTINSEMAPVQSDVSPNKRKSSQPTKMPQIPGNRVTKPTSTRTRKAKPGKKALKEIKILQSTTNLLMRKMPFLRWDFVLMHDFHDDTFLVAEWSKRSWMKCFLVFVTVGKPKPFWHCKKWLKPIWLLSSKTSIWLPCTPTEWPSCKRICNLFADFVPILNRTSIDLIISNKQTKLST